MRKVYRNSIYEEGNRAKKYGHDDEFYVIAAEMIDIPVDEFEGLEPSRRLFRRSRQIPVKSH
jgi:hypothetical protein